MLFLSNSFKGLSVIDKKERTINMYNGMNVSVNAEKKKADRKHIVYN